MKFQPHNDSHASRGLNTALIVLIAALLGAGAFLTGCGDDDSSGGIGFDTERPYPNDNNWSNNQGAPDVGGEAPEPGDGDFVPEEEEFLVREVATTAAYVFVPNSSADSNTVALIDGRDYSIRPIPVGMEPTVVRAAAVEGEGDVAYVLCEGDSTVAIIRADAPAREPGDKVHLLRVPHEVNALAISPDGRHLLAYIDPTQPLRDQSSIASLQSAVLIRLGDTRADDRVFELSVTRLIRDVVFTEDSAQAFVVGKEGINRIYLDQVQGDTMVAPLPLNLSESIFPPTDFEIEVSPAGDFLVARNSDFQGVALYRPPTDTGAAELRLVELSAIPTDIDLFSDADGKPAVLATLRAANELAIIDVEETFGAPEEAPLAPTVLPVEEVQPGLAQLTPAGDQVLLYSSLVAMPNLGILDLSTQMLRAYPLRNQIRSVAISANGETAVVVHKKREGQAPSDADPLAFFQYNYGLTLLDIATGYRRPVVLQAEPADLVMTETSDGAPLVFVMQPSGRAELRGFTRINLSNYRSDFFQLARQPEQMGMVAGKIFISQASREGRITFIDVDSGAQRTVSGYELNAGIQ